MGFLAIVFAVDLIVSTLCMYIATKLSFVKAQFKPLIAIVFIVSIISLIPTIGWILSFITFIYLLMKATSADFIDCLWVVAFIKLISFFVGLIFLSFIANPSIIELQSGLSLPDIPSSTISSA